MDKQIQKELLDVVKRNYDDIAEEFNETRKKFLWPELIKLTKGIKVGDRILDVGCGNGRLLEAFKYDRVNYLGVDNSEKLIEIAKGRYKLPSINFQIGDILELGKVPWIAPVSRYGTGFNYVFCVAVLQHIPGRDLQVAALKQLKNKIDENGKIILTVWNLWSQKKFRKLILRTELLKIFNKARLMPRRFSRKYSGKSRDPELALRASGDFGDILFEGFNKKSKRYYHAFRMGELKRIIKKSGLRIERIYKDKYNYYVIASRPATTNAGHANYQL